MTNVLEMLVSKRGKLVMEKAKLTREYEERQKALDAEIENINNALHVIEESVKDILCPRCVGRGTIRVCDAAGDINDEECPYCHGTGFTVTARRKIEREEMDNG